MFSALRKASPTKTADTVSKAKENKDKLKDLPKPEARSSFSQTPKVMATEGDAMAV